MANATNVLLSSILDILRERGIPHQISPSTYHPLCYSVVSPVLRSSRYNPFIYVFISAGVNTYAYEPVHHFYTGPHNLYNLSPAWKFGELLHPLNSISTYWINYVRCV